MLTLLAGIATGGGPAHAAARPAAASAVASTTTTTGHVTGLVSQPTPTLPGRAKAWR